MTDGQVFVYEIVAPETAVVLAGWWAWKRIQLRRARAAWNRRLAAHRRTRLRSPAA